MITANEMGPPQHQQRLDNTNFLAKRKALKEETEKTPMNDNGDNSIHWF